MEIDNIVKVTVGAAVVIIMIVAFAIPVMSGFTESSDGETGTNTPTTNIDDDPSKGLFELKPGITLTWDGGVTTVNGDTVTTDASHFTMFAFDGIQVGVTSMYAILYESSGLSQIQEITAVWDGSTLSVTTNNDNFTVASAYAFMMYYPSQSVPSGDWISDNDYVMIYDFDASTPTFQPAYVNEDTIIVNMGAAGKQNIGTYDDIPPLGSGDMIEFTTGDSEGSAIQLTGATGEGLLAVFVPETYYISEPVEAQVSGAAATIIDIMPLIMILGAVVATVATFTYYRS